MKHSSSLIATSLALVILLSSCGDKKDEVATKPAASATTTTTTATHAADKDGHEAPAGEATRTVEVKMVENAFKPASFKAHAGETVKFVFHNEGKLVHEAILGDEAEHVAHEKKMREQGQKMEHDEHEKPVPPGQKTEVTHTFKAGEALLFGCHLPGHFDAGMKAAITVS